MNKKLLASLLAVFLLSLFVRLYNFNSVGRIWDEGAYVELGRNAVNLFIHGKYFNEIQKDTNITDYNWFEFSDPPPLARYVYGIASICDAERYLPNGRVVLKYDLTCSRLVSVFVASLTSILVVLIATQYFSVFIGLMSGVFFSLLPIFVGLSQLATLESFIMFFFTLSVYLFLNLLKQFSIKKATVLGVVVGFAFLTKYTNLLLLPLFLWIYLLNYFMLKGKRNVRQDIFIGLAIISIALITFFLLWPFAWFNLQKMIDFEILLRYQQTKYSIPELFFGRLMFVPKLYFFIYFVLTTPIFVLILFIVGLFKMFLAVTKLPGVVQRYFSIKDITENYNIQKKFFYCVLIAWFIFPFFQSFYNYRQHGIRYIIEIYAPLSIIAAIGLGYIFEKVKKLSKLSFLVAMLLVVYMLSLLFKISPYYLDYFNEFVGGTKNVYEKRIFQLGWWGQGTKEAGEHLSKVARHNSTVGLAISPLGELVMPKLRDDIKTFTYNDKSTYDYIIVSYFHVVRHKFNDSKIINNYKPVYFVNAGGAHLLTVYEKK